jgi:hypothetical protein
MAESTMSDQATPARELFEPLHSEREIHTISRPSLSYWQDAWIRSVCIWCSACWRSRYWAR